MNEPSAKKKYTHQQLIIRHCPSMSHLSSTNPTPAVTGDREERTLVAFLILNLTIVVDVAVAAGSGGGGAASGAVGCVAIGLAGAAVGVVCQLRLSRFVWFGGAVGWGVTLTCA